MIFVLTLTTVTGFALILRRKTISDVSKSFFTIVIGFGVLIFTTFLFDGPREAESSVFLYSKENLEVGRRILLIVSIGIFFSAIMQKSFPKNLIPNRTLHYDVLSLSAQYACIFSSFLLLISNVFIRSFPLLYSRNVYLPVSWDIGLLSNVIAYLSYIAVFSCVIVSVQYKSYFLRIYAWINLLCWLIFYLSSSSRSVILIPLSYLFVKNLNASVHRNKLRDFFFIVMTIFLYSFTLNLRNTNTWGLSHVLHEFKSNLKLNQSSILDILFNINSSVSIAGATRNLSRYSLHDLWTSINPLPGYLTNWSTQSDALRINKFVPFSAFGEIASLGYSTLLFSVIFLFSIFMIQRKWLVLKFGLNGILTKIHLGLIYGSTFLMMQYNLRACMRVVYLSILIGLIGKFNFLPTFRKARK